MHRMFPTFACVFLFSLTVMGPVRAEVLSLTPASDAPGWFVNLKQFSESAHGTFTCEACHGDMAELGKPHPDSQDTSHLKSDATRIYDYHRCRTCHRESYERYLRGAHAKAMAEEKKAPAAAGSVSDSRKAPTCGECHSAHYSRAHLSKAVTGRQMTEVCGACHPAQKATYLENYHGKAAVYLGDEASAYCTDCHGAHECLSLKDKEAALAACRRCHPEAGDQFAEFVIHPTTQGIAGEAQEKEKRVAIIKMVTLIMTIIVILVVGFFYSHSFLWLLREIHEKLRKHQRGS
jgi:hypothetical protein